MICEYIDAEKQCGANAMKNSKFCFWHNPDTVEARDVARKKGGYNRKKKTSTVGNAYSVRSVEDIYRILELAINETIESLPNSAKPRTLGYLCQILLRVQETKELEKRIQELEFEVDMYLPDEDMED